MSSKHLLVIKSFNNKELVNAITKNGFSEISDILSEKNISGEDFLELTELSIRRWHVPSNQSKKIAECLLKIKNSPENFATLSTPVPSFKRGYSIKKSLDSENNTIKSQLELVIKPEKTPCSLYKPQYDSNKSDTPILRTKIENNNNNNNSDIEEELPEYGNIENAPAQTIKNTSPSLLPKPEIFERKSNNQFGNNKVATPPTKTEKRPWMANKNNLAAQVGTNQSPSSVTKKPWVRKDNNLLESEQTLRKPEIKLNIEATLLSKPERHRKMQSGPPTPVRNAGMKKETVFQQLDKSPSAPLKNKPKLKIDTSVEIRKSSEDKIKKYDRATAPSSPNKLTIALKKHKQTVMRTSTEIRPKIFESFRKTHQPSSTTPTSKPKLRQPALLLPVSEDNNFPDYLAMDKCSKKIENLSDDEGYLAPRSVSPQPAAASPSLSHQVNIRSNNRRPPAAIPREEFVQRESLSVDNIYSLDPTKKKREEDIGEYVEIASSLNEATVPEHAVFSRPVVESFKVVQGQLIPKTSPNLTRRPLPPPPTEYLDVGQPIVLTEEEKRVTDIIYNEYENENFIESSRNLTLNRRQAVIVTNSLIASCSGAHGISKINNRDELGRAFNLESPGSDEPDVAPALLPKKAKADDAEEIRENNEDDATSNLLSVVANSSYEVYHNPNLPLPPAVFPEIDTLNTNSEIDDASDDSDDECGDISSQSLTGPYYQYTDRKGAKLALQDREDGSFLFRSSKKSFLGLTIKYRNKFFNLSLTKTPSNKLKILSGEESPEFSSLREFVNYFTREPLTFIYENERIAGIYLKEPPH